MWRLPLKLREWAGCEPARSRGFRRRGQPKRRRDGHDRQPEQPLDRDELADVVPLDPVADPLEEIAEDERPKAPRPRHQRDEDGSHQQRERDAHHMDGEIESIPPITTDGENITVGGESPFPVTSDAINVISAPDVVTYQTNFTSDEVVKFYQDEFGKSGYTEDTSLSVNFNGIFTLAFDGHESGRKIILAGAPVGDGTTSVTITLQ